MFTNHCPAVLINHETYRLWYKPEPVFKMPQVNAMFLLCTMIENPRHSSWRNYRPKRCKNFATLLRIMPPWPDCIVILVSIVLALKSPLPVIITTTDSIIQHHHFIDDNNNNVGRQHVVCSHPRQVGETLHCILGRTTLSTRHECGVFGILPLEYPNMSRMFATFETIRFGLLSSTSLASFHLEALIHGNVAPTQAVEWTEMVLQAFQPHPLLHPVSLRVACLPVGHDCVYELAGYNPDSTNSCIMHLYQMGLIDLRTNATLSLVQHLIREPSFHQLHTEEQLGHIVHTGVKTNGERIKGLMILIQGESFDPIYMEP